MKKTGMPFDKISILAEQESWRKDIYRPLSYMHKWWARRLGSVFRGLLIADSSNYNFDFDSFYTHPGLSGKTVFDPFMGSGTTIIEATKLGANAIGCDINPVAANLVSTALSCYNKNEVIREFKNIENKCKNAILSYYKSVDDGKKCDVLYYFWVSFLVCDDCGAKIPLFKNLIFSKNAYPSKKPTSQSICPICGEINECHFQATEVVCQGCHETYNPQEGAIDKANMYTCHVCGRKEKVIDYIRRHRVPLESKMYAKMVMINGVKSYRKITEYDLEIYETACRNLKIYQDLIPQDRIYPGINTNQIINYEYRFWKDMFNPRQLLAICIIEKAINEIKDDNLKQLFAILLSGVLEFNNMFCSFKGEGTGAVRPIFYNHILKPELTPLETNVWGLKASSGAFSTFFETRILRALNYKEQPYEIYITQDGKADRHYLQVSNIEKFVCKSWAALDSEHPMILCQDSSTINIPEKSVDLVLTDPPFFDNVNYSELADFFYVWQKKMRIGYADKTDDSTRKPEEVQDSDATLFGSKLLAVFSKCYSVLKDSGRLVFTYHHSRTDGWVPVFDAIDKAGFFIDNTFLVKAEMAVSVAIQAAKEPINYDLVLVCCKKDQYYKGLSNLTNKNSIQTELSQFSSNNLKLSKNDKLMLLYGKALCKMSRKGMHDISIKDIEDTVAELSSYIGEA